MSTRNPVSFLLLPAILLGSAVCSAQTNTWNLQVANPPMQGTVIEDIAYDPVHGQAVLLDKGGQTWTWSSATLSWTQQYPMHAPSNRSAAAMAWDGNSQAILLFGGNLAGSGVSGDDTWAWNGTDWSLLAPANSPPARIGANMVWNSSQNLAVLFGGHAGGTPDTLFNDTWTWNGTNWTLVTTAAAPSPRYNTGMAFDAASSQVLVYGGNAGSTGVAAVNAETWTFDGSNWTKQTPGTSPPAMNSEGMTYDPQHQQVVLFGGTALNTAGTAAAASAQTWIWNGSTWAEQTLTNSPTARTNISLVYDTTNNQIFQVGGSGPNGDLMSAYTWDGASAAGWTAQTPNLRYLANLAYDTVNQKGWLLAGWNGSQRYTDIWAWNGTSWTSMPYSGIPIPAREAAVAVDDPVANAIVGFGGINGVATGNQLPNTIYTWAITSQIWSSTAAAGGVNATRTGNAAAYVPVATPPGTMIFGGASMTSTVGSGTYLWDSAKSVMAKVAAPGPSGRTGAVMVYDSVRQQVVLFGGTSNTTSFTGSDFNDTWIGTWAGVTTGAFSWTQVTPVTSPPARAFHSMAFDGQYVWMTGGGTNLTQAGAAVAGKTPAYYNDLWYWDGTNWNQATAPPTGPAANMGMSMTFDANHGASGAGGQGEMVLFGGDYLTGTVHNLNANTWVWGLAAPGSIGVNAYAVQGGAVAPVTATFTLYGPCTISDKTPCTKNPQPGGPTLSLTAQQPGYYSVVYGALTGYTAPATQNIELPSGGAIVFRGDYVLQTGNIPDANHVVNAATFASGPIAPGEMISIFGTGIGPATGVGAQLNAAGTTVANNIGNTRVSFGGTGAPLLFVSSGQVNCVVPYEVAGKAGVPLLIQYLGNNTNSVMVPIGQTSPGIFVISAAGVTPQQGAILNQDSSINGASNPAATGSVIQIYATGEGVTTPASTDGKLALGTSFPAPVAAVSVTIGGVAASIAFAGTAPGGVAGFLQVNAVVPAGVASGAQPIVLTVGPNSSPAGPTVAIQ